MNSVTDAILRHLKPLIGLQLSIARRAATMRIFHFGRVGPVERGTAGKYAMHIQCAWRLDGPEGILTGSEDLYQPAETSGEIDWERWNYETGNLQDQRLGEWLGGYDPQTRSHIYTGEHIRVEMVEADDFGGAILHLSGGFRLVLFPAGSKKENWRLFRPQHRQAHFVISGGGVEDTE